MAEMTEIINENEIEKDAEIKENEEIAKNTDMINQNNEEKVTKERKITDEMKSELNDFEENCLIISEKTKKVILPFKHNEIVEQYKENEQYSSLQDVIKNKYMVNLSEYRFPVTSRIKEAYRLMRNKEGAGILSSVGLAMELAWNSYLNPAVITACKNKTELDIYLDCLYNNELDDFDIFDVKYEYMPMTI